MELGPCAGRGGASGICGKLAGISLSSENRGATGSGWVSKGAATGSGCDASGAAVAGGRRGRGRRRRDLGPERIIRPRRDDEGREDQMRPGRAEAGRLRPFENGNSA